MSKPIRFRSIVGSILLLSFTSSCKVEPAPSTVKHEFGQTSVQPKTELINCHTTPSESIGADSARYPKTVAYLKGVAMHIMLANPATFSGPFAPGNFCFHVQNDPTFNAFAQPNYREVTFHTTALMQLQNDPQVAAIMAHELAHITMQHSGILTHSDFKKVETKISGSDSEYNRIKEKYSKVAEEYYKKAAEIDGMLKQIAAAGAKDKKAVQDINALEKILRDNESIQNYSPSQWQKLADQMAGYYLQIMGGDDAENGVAVVHKISEIRKYEGDLKKMGEEMSTARESIVSGAASQIGIEQANNGKEREADEVGYELFLRSRMNAGNFMSALGHLVALENPEAKDQAFLHCLKNMLQSLRISPVRGADSHPTGCWRLLNVSVAENTKHQKDYAELIPAATLMAIPGGMTLAEVRAEIEKAPAPVKDPAIQQEANEKKELCQKMGGTWNDPNQFCGLPLQMTPEEIKLSCVKGNGQWHEKCQCLPIDWKLEELDVASCLPKNFKNNFPPGDDGSESGDGDGAGSPPI